MKTPVITVTNGNGDTFAVRYLPEGARYGRTGSLVTDRATAEFYDTATADDTSRPSGGLLGQFVSRYYVETIRDGDAGLMLGTESPRWRLDAPAMRTVREFLSTFPTQLTIGDA